jgi:hypothetical protein
LKLISVEAPNDGAHDDAEEETQVEEVGDLGVVVVKVDSEE